MAHVDSDMLMGLKDLLGGKFSQLVESYITDCSARFERMKVAASGNDLAEVRQEAHGIKGSSRNVGANGLGDLCGVIEDQSHKNDDTDLDQKIAAAEQLFAAIRDELNLLLN
ncbi:MAG: HPt (histidine-containing phosphotransfer) domain-containing protein [Flavobacteriales bacterium]|jgi:HPt (histidine-containing phosphotransfer) domain-containing protein